MTMQARKQPRTGRRGRSPTDVLAGVAAIVALLLLLTGVPLALIVLFGLPIPHTMPSLSLLTHRLTPGAVLKVCSVVVWLAWLQLVWCVIAEVSAAARNSGMPAKVPLAGVTQAFVHRLVTAALLLTTAAALAPAAAYHPVPAPRATAPRTGPGIVSGAVVASHQGLHGVGPAGGAGAGGLAAGSTNGSGADGASGSGPAAAGLTALELALPPGPGGDAADGNGHAPGTPGAIAWEDPAAGQDHAAVQAPGAAFLAPRTEKIYVVKPPEGRFHESLWEIAERHLGNGRRYREIFELNAGRPQPDGSRLTIASLIRPGWILVMPHDAYGPGIQEITVGPPRHHPAGHVSPAHPAPGHHQPPSPAHRHGLAPGPTATPGKPTAAAAPPGSSVQPTPEATGPGTPATAGPTAPGTPEPGATSHPAPAHAANQGGEPAYPFELAGAGLLAAGVLYALERRRRRQRGHRLAGRRVAVPRPDVAWAEAALLLGEDQAAAELLDAGLRHLGEALTREGRAAPAVFAAHVGEENVDLWVTPAGLAAPAPWYAVGDGQVWRLPLAAVPGLDLARLRHAVAPYPGLVTIGTDATGRVLVDVASAQGLIAVGGPQDLVRDTLTAMATELATSRWSEGIQLTLVGFGEDLEVLAPDRVRMVPTLAEALPDLETWAAEVADAAAVRAGPAPAGAEGMRVEAWEPHYLITAVPPSTGWERERLLALARSGQAAGAGYVAAGDVPGAVWSWEISEGGRLRAGQLGLDVEAQRIPAEQEAALVELFETAGDLAGSPLSAPVAEASPSERLMTGAETAVEVTLLGPVRVGAPGQIEPDRLPIATELVVYLATHPGGVHPNALTAAIWPRGVTPEARDLVLGRVTDWLGTDGLGRPHLASDASGRLRLGSGVRVDWHVFSTLVTLAGQVAGQAGGASSRPSGAHAAPAGGARGQDEEDLLAQALGLVSGPFLAGRARGRYAWLAADGLEYEVEARVADAAHRLCELRLAAGDPGGAIEAVRAGLLLAAWDELLWRDLLAAVHATGSEEELREVVSEIFERGTADGGPGLSPQTEALIDELLPSWRWSVP